MQLLSLLAAASVATAAALTPRQQIGNLLYPSGTFRHWVNTGAIITDPQDQLLIVKNGRAADETTTIVTFDFPADSAGKKCELLFELWGDRDHSTGTQTLDVFTYTDPPQALAALAVEIKSRDVHVGRIVAPLQANATWTQSYHGYPTIDCPAGARLGLQYVGAGDAVEVRWDIGVTGPRFRIHY
ncbi:uncharacterized protein DNG_09711 [Cephalotrichum gorgonifer]|uniref:Ubiquitin 3 binding protein But2 C-terminal domain-containing protein n=1 Tax=Cephalotrichum gorgonifer TaxID=2041049 RepID=A0AAE8N8J5_9PEZI|nr:uncharacterized protein DNG_09711 [Cephalotrichum gorgonifer]